MMNVVLQPAFSELNDFINTLPERFEGEGLSIYKGRNEIKVYDVNGLKVNVKAFRRPNYINRFVYSYIRPSKAKRSFENSKRMLTLGFDVPEPIAYLEIKRGGLLDRSFYVSIQCPYENDFRCFNRRTLTDELTIVPKSFGTYVARMHEAGILHKDLSIGNVLFAVNDEHVAFCLVDLNRMQFGKTIGLKKSCQNVSRLRGDDAFFRQFAHSYATVRQFNAEDCFKKMTDSVRKSQVWFKRKAERKQRLRALRKVW